MTKTMRKCALTGVSILLGAATGVLLYRNRKVITGFIHELTGSGADDFDDVDDFDDFDDYDSSEDFESTVMDFEPRAAANENDIVIDRTADRADAAADGAEADSTDGADSVK